MRSLLTPRRSVRGVTLAEGVMVIFIGGLLLSVPEPKLAPLLSRAGEAGLDLWEVGEVVAGEEIQVNP